MLFFFRLPLSARHPLSYRPWTKDLRLLVLADVSSLPWFRCSLSCISWPATKTRWRTPHDLREEDEYTCSINWTLYCPFEREINVLVSFCSSLRVISVAFFSFLNDEDCFCCWFIEIRDENAGLYWWLRVAIRTCRKRELIFCFFFISYEINEMISILKFTQLIPTETVSFQITFSYE